jgi:sugar phosphate isomerase/epimerase
MFKNLSTQALGISGSQSEIIELALSHGFRGLDLDIVEFQKQVETRGLATSRRLWDSAKLRLGRFHLPLELAAESSDFAAALAKLDGQAKLAAEVGCTRAVTRIAPASDELPYHQNFELHRKRIAEVAGVLEAHGVQLGIGFLAAPPWRQDKPYQFICQLEPLVMLLGLSGKTDVGLALDLWDLHVGGGSVEDLRKLSTKVVSVELADFPADTDRASATEQDRWLPGESGQIDAAAALTLLAEKGYDGPVTPVPDRSRFGGARREEIGRRTGQALDQVWKAAGLSPAGKLAAVRK